MAVELSVRNKWPHRQKPGASEPHSMALWPNTETQDIRRSSHPASMLMAAQGLRENKNEAKTGAICFFHNWTDQLAVHRHMMESCSVLGRISGLQRDCLWGRTAHFESGQDMGAISSEHIIIKTTFLCLHLCYGYVIPSPCRECKWSPTRATLSPVKWLLYCVIQILCSWRTPF